MLACGRKRAPPPAFRSRGKRRGGDLPGLGPSGHEVRRRARAVSGASIRSLDQQPVHVAAGADALHDLLPQVAALIEVQRVQSAGSPAVGWYRRCPRRSGATPCSMRTVRTASGGRRLPAGGLSRAMHSSLSAGREKDAEPGQAGERSRRATSRIVPGGVRVIGASGDGGARRGEDPGGGADLPRRGRRASPRRPRASPRPR